MAISWPVGIQDLVNGENFSMEFGETVLRTQMDVGPAKLRRRTTRPIDKYTVSINLYESDFITFQQFFNTTLNGGINIFDFLNPLTGSTDQFRFTQPPSISPLGTAGWFRVTMSWERLP